MFGLTALGVLHADVESLFKKDIDLLEGVQRIATKIILGYKHYCYEDRLALCQLSTLETER